MSTDLELSKSQANVAAGGKPDFSCRFRTQPQFTLVLQDTHMSLIYAQPTLAGSLCPGLPPLSLRTPS